MKTLMDLKEQLQEDLMSILDGHASLETQDIVCQAVVDRVNEYATIEDAPQGCSSLSPKVWLDQQ